MNDPGTPDLPRAERPHPLRFVWQINAEGCFILDSEEFGKLAGPRTTSMLGKPWDELSAALNLDPDSQVGRAIATRETWSGLTVAWPIDHSPERLAVELSGLPVFDRGRTFRGYRGFGVCRDPPRFGTLNQLPQTASATAAVPADFVTMPDDTEVSHAIGESRPAAFPGGFDVGAFSLPTEPPAPSAYPSGKNIVPFRAPPAEIPVAPILAPVERGAFRELARRLAERLKATGPMQDAAGCADTTHKAVESPTPDFTLGGLANAARPAFDPLFARGTKRKAEIDLAHITAAKMEIAELKAILDTAADGIIVFDGKGVIVFSNRSAQTLFRYNANELVGLSLVDLLAIESSKIAFEYMESLQPEDAAHLRADSRSVIGRDSQGRMMTLMMTVRLLGNGSEKRCAAFRGITHWRMTEQEVIEAGKLELAFTDVAINDVVQQCVDTVNQQASRKCIIIRTALAPKLPHIVADASSVKQIVLNLLSNSIKLTAPGGQVIVATALSNADEVALRVRDTGPWVSASEIINTLDPLREAGISTRFGSGDTDLNLPLARALAEANQASFRIDSKLEAGTLIEILFTATRGLAQ